MRILVTGAAGYIGANIARHLAENGLEVIGNYRQPSSRLDSLIAAGVRLEGCALANARTIPGPIDAIVHCAAAAGPWHTNDDIVRDNILAMQSLLDIATAWRVKFFIFMSSVSVYGKITTPRIDENTPSQDLGTYGYSKVCGEWLLRCKSDRISSLALRLPGIIGPGVPMDRNWLPRMAERIRSRGTALECYGLNNPFNNAVHITDLCALVLSILNLPNWPRGFDAAVLGAKGKLTVRKALETLASGLGKKIKLIQAPGEQTSFLLDSSHAISHWGYRPMEIGAMIGRFAKELNCA